MIPTSQNERFIFSSFPSVSSSSVPSNPTVPLQEQTKESRKDVQKGTDSDNVVSLMGFNFSSYYRDRSSLPIHIEKPKTSWMSGGEEFARYMNEKYIPFVEKHTNDSSNVIVYAKRGTTGIAGQISGMCDVLFLSILNDRVFKC